MILADPLPGLMKNGSGIRLMARNRTTPTVLLLGLLPGAPGYTQAETWTHYSRWHQSDGSAFDHHAWIVEIDSFVQRLSFRRTRALASERLRDEGHSKGRSRNIAGRERLQQSSVSASEILV